MGEKKELIYWTCKEKDENLFRDTGCGYSGREPERTFEYTLKDSFLSYSVLVLSHFSKIKEKCFCLLPIDLLMH